MHYPVFLAHVDITQMAKEVSADQNVYFVMRDIIAMLHLQIKLANAKVVINVLLVVVLQFVAQQEHIVTGIEVEHVTPVEQVIIVPKVVDMTIKNAKMDIIPS